MGRERDEETGQFEEKFQDEDFIEVLAAHDGGMGTKAIADEVGCAYRTAHDRLEKLEAKDVVTSRRIANALLWELDADNTGADE